MKAVNIMLSLLIMSLTATAALKGLFSVNSLIVKCETKTMEKKQNPYIGMWVTKDGYIRQELLPNGRYDEARGSKKSAYTGSYTITGNHIDYKDDTGFTADGTFDGSVLYHGGYVFYKEKKG